MNRRKVISKDVQSKRGGEIGFLFRKARRQAGEPAHSGSHGQIVSLNVRGRDQVFVRPATNDFALKPHITEKGVVS